MSVYSAQDIVAVLYVDEQPLFSFDSVLRSGLSKVQSTKVQSPLNVSLGEVVAENSRLVPPNFHLVLPYLYCAT